MNLAYDRIDEYNIDFDYGFAGGVVYGIDCGCTNIRLELEHSYRQNRIDDIRVGTVSSGVGGDLQEWAVFMNLLYDFPICWKYTPFAGFGVGWEYEKTALKGSSFSKIERIDSAFTAQIIGGFSYRYSSRLSFNIACRCYLFDDDIYSASLGIGYRYYFCSYP